jgi:hypothetical protein
VTFASTDSAWTLIVEPGDNLITPNEAPVPLDPGTYTYEFRYNGDDISGDTFDITGCNATIHLLKEVDNSAGGSAVPGDFQITLSGDQTYSGYNGDTLSVVPGTYSLTEAQLPNYVSEFGGGCYQNGVQPLVAAADPAAPSFTFGAGEEWTCGFTNTYVPPQQVTVHLLKEVDNSAGGSAVPGDFQITLSGDNTYSGYNGDTLIVDPGTYSLTEAQLPGYFSEFGGGCYQNGVVGALTVTDGTTAPSFTFGAGEEWTCGFTNTFVAPPAPPVTACGGTASFSDVPDGWYIALQGPGENDWSIVTSGFDSIALAPGDYHYQWRDADGNDQNQTVNGSGDFTIGTCNVPIFQKVIVGGSATYSDFTFAITVGTNVTTVPGSALDANGVYWAPALVGSSTITETQSAGAYSTTYSLGGGTPNTTGCSQAEITSFVAEQQPLCVITNTYHPSLPCTLANGCTTPTPVSTPTPTPTPVSTPTPTPTPVSTPTPIPTPLPTLPPTNTAGPSDGPGSGFPVSDLALLGVGALFGALYLFSLRRRTMTR